MMPIKLRAFVANLTPPKKAVLAYDAASEIGLEIKIGRPAPTDD
jgi:hypothetical protein